MSYQITWFVLWGVLWAVYFMLDGFVLGTGVLHPLVAKTDGERRSVINSIGPVWDGNEVWLITAGGATFAAFPTTYAAMFSYLYTALLLLLFALIVRGVAFEFRGKGEGDRWRRSWDKAIFVSSLVPALLFGVAFGNIFQGLPMDGAGYHGSLVGLLNPYGLVTGILFVLLFVVHGALYLSLKTDGELRQRAETTAARTWPALLVVAATFLVHTWFATGLYDNFLSHPALFVVPALAVAALAGIRIFLSQGSLGRAFTSSCATILLVVGTGLTGLFPNLIPSSIDPKFNLDIYNSSSSLYTLRIMTIVAFIFVPIVIAYKIWVYRVFRHPVTAEEIADNVHPY